MLSIDVLRNLQRRPLLWCKSWVCWGGLKYHGSHYDLTAAELQLQMGLKHFKDSRLKDTDCKLILPDLLCTTTVLLENKIFQLPLGNDTFMTSYRSRGQYSQNMNWIEPSSLLTFTGPSFDLFGGLIFLYDSIGYTIQDLSGPPYHRV